MIPKLISDEESSKLLESDIISEYGKYEPEGLFYHKDGSNWVGIDNSSGDANVEEFDTKEACLFWLDNYNSEYAFESPELINSVFNAAFKSKEDYLYRLINYFLAIFALVGITNTYVFQKFLKSFNEQYERGVYDK